MYECKQCKQKLNKYMQEIQKNELYAEKKAPAVPLLREPFFYSFIFLFLIFVPVAFVIAATGSSAATSDFRIK